MENFVEININSKQYVLVDQYEYKEDNIFHFGALSLEEEVFCKKENGKYIQITDNFEIAIIKNKFGLINLPCYYDTDDMLALVKRVVSQFKLRPIQNKIYRLMGKESLDLEEADKIRKEQIDNFNSIKQEFNIDIDLEEITNKINKVNLFKVNNFLNRGLRGFYRPLTNSITYRKDIVNEDSIANKSTRLHEFVHAMTGKNLFLYSIISKGLMEGQTENLAQSRHNNTSSKEIYVHDGKSDTIHYNFSQNTSYKNLVTLIQQMEYATGKKSYESILKGDMSFESGFAKEYGKSLMTVMAYRMRRLHSEEYSRSLNKLLKIPFDTAKYLKETQNILMEKVFNKDFEKIENMEDAKRYLEKLRNFETVRTKISTYNFDKGAEIQDTSFKEYYYQKFSDISKLLEEKGMRNENIKEELEKFQYKEQEFKPMLTKQEEPEYIRWHFIQSLSREIIRNNNMIDINNCDFKAFKMSDEKDYNYFIIKKGTDEGYFLYTDSSEKTEKLLENMSEDERNSNEGNLTEKIKALRDNGFEEMDLETNSDEIQHGIIKNLKKEITRNEEIIDKYKYNDQQYSNYVEMKNKQIINILSQYGEKYGEVSEVKKIEEKEKSKDESLQDIFLKGISFASISMKSLIKNALGKENTRLEEIVKVDNIEKNELEAENTKDGVNLDDR